MQVDVYLWRLCQLSTQLVPLLHSLQEWPTLNQDDRKRQWELPGIAAPASVATTTSTTNTWGLTSAELQRIDQGMARAAVYLQLYRSFVRRNYRQPSPQLQRLDGALDLLYRSQCRVQLLHGVLFGAHTWTSAGLSVQNVVPLFWGHLESPQRIQHLRNFVTVTWAETLFRNFAQRFSALRAAHVAV